MNFVKVEVFLRHKIVLSKLKLCVDNFCVPKVNFIEIINKYTPQLAQHSVVNHCVFFTIYCRKYFVTTFYFSFHILIEKVRGTLARKGNESTRVWF